MKLSTVFIGLLALLMPLVGAWSKEGKSRTPSGTPVLPNGSSCTTVSELTCHAADREIFRLRDEIAAAEGSSATFYDLLGVPSTASQEDISKAYRKQSRMLHPDKVKQQLRAKKLAEAKKASAGRKKPGVTVAKSPTAAEIRAAVKLASERQARLSLVANVLRGPGRERYDHFLAHGFPVWKGTEYYYTRYRPGLGTTVTGVLLFGTGAVHYLALYLGWRRQREFVERYVRFARHAAWGESLGVPGLDGLGASGGGGDTLLRHSGPLVVHSDGEAESDDGRDHIPVNRKERRAREREERREAAKKGRKPKPTSAAAAQAQASDGTRTGPQGPKKRVVAENGKVLVVDSLGNVYLEQEDEDGNVEEFLLDVSGIS